MILCCGEALIDMIPGPDGAYRPHCGGAVFNTAIALGRLGAPAGMLTGLSSDHFGRMLEDGLAASQVDTARVIRSDRLTTLAFVVLTDGKASYTFYDENSAGRMIAPADLPPLGEEVTALFFGGISLVMEPGAEAYEALLAREAGRRVVMIDPNIRPGFITDEARYRARLSRMLALSDIVKVSDEDLDWLVPGGDIAAQAAALSGPKIVIVTRGAEGATAFLPGGRRVEVASQAVEVADTVGAGDAFNAGVLAYLSRAGLLSKTAPDTVRDAALSDALRYAARVAAVTVSRPGADPPWAEELADTQP